MTVAEYETLAQSELSALEIGKIDLERLVVDTERKTASLKVNIHIELQGGIKDRLEFIFTLYLTNSYDQIHAVVQFADSVKTNDIVAKITDRGRAPGDGG